MAPSFTDVRGGCEFLFCLQGKTWNSEKYPTLANWLANPPFFGLVLVTQHCDPPYRATGHKYTYLGETVTATRKDRYRILR